MQLRVCRWLIRCIRIRQLFSCPPPPLHFGLLQTESLPAEVVSKSNPVRQQRNFQHPWAVTLGFLFAHFLQLTQYGDFQDFLDLLDMKGIGHSTEGGMSYRVVISNRWKQETVRLCCGCPCSFVEERNYSVSALHSSYILPPPPCPHSTLEWSSSSERVIVRDRGLVCLLLCRGK